MSNHLPSIFPLRDKEPEFEYKLTHGNNKLSNWLEEYSQLSLGRENRKRNWDEKTIDEVNEEDSDDMTFSDNDFSQISGNAQPPKRRLTSSILSPIANVTPIYPNSASSNDEPANIQSRTPGVGSQSNTPISDMEDQPQQLPLPSPSASPIQSSIKQDINDPLENYLANIPTTQLELVDLIKNLSQFLDSNNRNHVIFKLLQDVNRSSLSTLNNVLHDTLRRDLLSNLPSEITYNILSQLDYKSLYNISLVCKNWYKLINRSNVWIDLLKRDHLVEGQNDINNELKDLKQLIKQWGFDIPLNKINIYQLLYKKRKIIYNRWMNPKFEPRRISINIPSPGNNVVTCLQHDDDKIISGVDDKLINIYSTKTGEFLKVLKGHEGGVWALKYTGNTLVSGSTDRTVRIWNIKQGKCTHIFRGHTSTVRCLDILHPVVIGKDDSGKDIIFPKEPLLVTGSRDHNLIVWKLPIQPDDGVKLSELGPDDSNDDEMVDESAIGYDANDPSNPYLVKVLSGHTQSVRSVSAYGNIIVSGSYDATVRVWDLLDNANCKHVLNGHTDRIYSTSLDFKNKVCYSGSMDSRIHIWNFESGELLHSLEGHASLVGLLELSKDYLVSAAADSTLRVWNPSTGEPYSKLEGHTAAITCFQHDPLRIISGSERLLKLWDIRKGKFVRDLLADVTGGIWQVSFDFNICVAAVQRNINDKEETFLELLDFSQPPGEI